MTSCDSSSIANRRVMSFFCFVDYPYPADGVALCRVNPCSHRTDRQFFAALQLVLKFRGSELQALQNPSHLFSVIRVIPGCYLRHSP